MDLKKLNNLLNYLFESINYLFNNTNFNDLNQLIILIILFCINNIFLLNKLVHLLKIKIIELKENKNKYLLKIIDIEYNLNNININILESYNKFSKKENNSINLELIQDNLTFIINNDNNLDLYSIDDLESLININNNNLFNFKNDNNYADYKLVDIGFKNFYKLHCFYKLIYTLPFNLLIYIYEINQVVIKIGNNEKYQYINSKLYPVYFYNDKNINNNSIICNNNIKILNKKCHLENCKFYHDYIIGYKDNYHLTRQFSSNPIVYNCQDFKDGTKVQTNIKKIKWYDAINLYQSSLSNILIGCMHSLEN